MIRIFKTAIVSVFIWIFIFASCGPNRETVLNELKPKYQILVIDSCEYISLFASAYNINNTAIIHKANCKNPIHK